MLIAAFLAYTTVILNLLLGIMAFRANRHGAANRTFLAMCITLCFWGLGYAFMITAPDVQTANAWHIFSAIGWCFFYSVFVLFALYFTESPVLGEKPWIKGLQQVPPLFYFLHVATRSTEQLVRTDLGWVYLYHKEAEWQVAFIVYYTSYAMFAFWRIYRWGKGNVGQEQAKTGAAFGPLDVDGFLHWRCRSTLICRLPRLSGAAGGYTAFAAFYCGCLVCNHPLPLHDPELSYGSQSHPAEND